MRAVINKMSLKFESHSVNEAFARQAVGAFVAQLDPTMEELGDIKTVVSEAVTNAIVADVLHDFADKLEGADDVSAVVREIVAETWHAHGRIIFNGNGYDESWVVEAEKRGLLNFKSAADAFPHYVDQKNLDLFAKHNVYTAAEINSRMETQLEEYNKILHIEALTMIDMAKKKYIPTCIAYTKELCDAVAVKKSLEICPCVEKELAEKVSSLTKDAYTTTNKLEEAVAAAAAKDSCVLDMAKSYREEVIPVMNALRAAVDGLEVILPSCKWPVPAYSDIIFNV